MNKELLTILLELRQKYGAAIFRAAQRRRLRALLLDYTKNKCSREVYLLLEGLELGIFRTLSQAGGAAQQQVCFRRLTYDYCMAEEGARYVIDIWSAVASVPASGQVLLRQAN